MDSLPRTTSREGATSQHGLFASTDNEEQRPDAASSQSSSAPTADDPTKTAPALVGQLPRSPSHSLLSTSSTPPLAIRKSRFADIGTTSANIGRASISMPPPATKPSSTYKPSASRVPSAAMAIKDGSGTNPSTDGLVQKPTVEDSIGSDDLEKTPSVVGQQPHPTSEPYTPLTLPDSSLRPPYSTTTNSDLEGNRLSFSSLYSLGSAICSGGAGGSSAPPSAASSNAGSVRNGGLDGSTPNTAPLSPSLGSARGEASSSATTATDPVSVAANSVTQHQVSLSSSKDSSLNSNTWNPVSFPRPTPRRSRSRTQQHSTGSTAPSSTASPNNSDRSSQAKPAPLGRIGVCALDVKARSKASRNILTRLQSNSEFDIIVFGDKVILDEEVENWPVCEFLISFFSDGFPLDKAIAYSKLRKPFCINDLPMQKILWDRRICLRILDNMEVPTPQRIEVNRDGGPTLESAELAERVYRFSGVKLAGSENGIGGRMQVAKKVELIDEGDTLLVDGVTLKKPFVEKPISGEDHNIRIYFPRSHEGGGGRKLFRKIGNKSSEWDKDLIVPRAITEEGSSYLYEKFLHVENAEDIKAYTVGPDFCHAETRKSPVVDGLVRRNTHGKEIRYITGLTKEESTMATKIVNGFGQRVCGFDLLRAGNRSYVIDVNGWSFVKDNKEYYDKCASILKDLFVRDKRKRDGSIPPAETQVEAVPENGPPHRKGTFSNHRATFKSIMRKSPSMSRLTGHHGGQRYSAGSPDLSSATTPVTSPPSAETESTAIPPKNFAEIVELPPPAVPTNQAHKTEEKLTDQQTSDAVPQPASKHSWKLKGMVAVVRHADRTPKQKFKFTFHSQPFVELLKGHQEEVLLKGEAALNSVQEAVKVAMKQGIEDPDKLQLLRTSLARKGAWAGTKVQIKPMFRKRKPEESLPKLCEEVGEKAAEALSVAELPTSASDSKIESEIGHTRSESFDGSTLSRFSAVENDLILDKLQLIIKWGGEPTHAARYQSQDLGENMRNDLSLMNKEALNDVRVFTSSERRVRTSAQIWAASFLDQKEVAEDSITVRKDLLDDSNAAKDVMDKVKKKLKLLLREGHKAPPQFAWPDNTPEPSIVVRSVVELMNFHRKVMRHNFKKLSSGAAASLSALNKSSEGSPAPVPASSSALAHAHAVSSVQARWCCGEDPDLFKERWEKLFSEFCDSEKVDPSKISELYDTMKFDALHNRQFLEWVFTPSTSMLEEENTGDEVSWKKSAEDATSQENKPPHGKDEIKDGHGSEKTADKSSGNLAQRMGFGRKATTSIPASQILPQEDPQDSYFKLFVGNGQTKAKQDVRLHKLRELYKYAKVLFDFVCPQEYGISDSEKLEIGLLTSLPLLKEIVNDLEEVQASDDAKSFIYFTKESHIYTLLNCILEGGVKTKIQRNAIPELDYLSSITFELYEAEDRDQETFTYSIKITITPGCHTSDPLDVQLDSKHSIGCAPRRSLTAHQDWKEVIETLRAKFHTVKLPKSFLAVNVSESHASESHASDTSQGDGTAPMSVDD